MTKIEAEKDAKKLNATEPKWFCPMINAKCRKDCINFVIAYPVDTNEKSHGMLHSADDDSFKVEGFFCSNAMFLGPQEFFCGH